MDTRLMGPFMQVTFNSDPARLPFRELPHGSWSELYLMYKSFMGSKNQNEASRSLFFHICKRWKKCIGFHQASHHAQCLICSRYKALLQNTSETQLYLIFILLCVVYVLGLRTKNKHTIQLSNPGFQSCSEDRWWASGPLHSKLERSGSILACSGTSKGSTRPLRNDLGYLWSSENGSSCLAKTSSS